MKKSLSHVVTSTWIVLLSFAAGSQTVLAGEPASVPQMTLFVYNRAQVKPETLRKANEVATRIFRNAGIEVTVVVDPPPSLQAETRPTLPPSVPFFVQILSPEMVKRLRLPSTVLGLAPGTPKEQGRNKVYVFDHVAARMAWEQATAHVSKTISFPAHKGQILGYAIAHEIGHVLLNLKAHTRKGIMQGKWERDALADIACGRLHFSPKQAERIEAEVARRESSIGSALLQ